MDRFKVKPEDRMAKYLAKTMVTRFFEHNVLRVGGQLAFFILLSLFPFLVFVNAIIGSFNISSTGLNDLLSPIFPQQIVELILGYIDQVTQNQSIGLLSIAIVVVIFSASAAARSLTYSINTAYGINDTQHIVRNFLFSLLYVITAGIVAFIILIFITSSEEFLLEIVQITNVPQTIITLLSVFRWGALVAIMFLVLAVMYKITPSKKVHFKDTMPGTILATAGLIALTYGFSAYVTFFAHSSIMSGTIGTMILLMLWVYFASVIIILGAELNSSVEQWSNKR